MLNVDIWLVHAIFVGKIVCSIVCELNFLISQEYSYLHPLNFLIAHEYSYLHSLNFLISHE